MAPAAIELMRKTIENDSYLVQEDEDGELHASDKTGAPGELATKPTLNDQLRAASKIIDIAAPKAPELHLHAHKHKHNLDDDDINDIKARAIELRRANGLIAEAEIIEENPDENSQTSDA